MTGGTYVHPADPSRDGEDWEGRRREAARDAHGNGVPHDRQLCGISHRDTTVTWHFTRYGNPGNGPFDTEPTTYRPRAERDAANRLAAGWASAEVVTVPVPPHGYHPGMLSAAGQKCALCDQLEGHELHA